ncbi:MAG: hypothetical protein EPO35_09665 [Acidobacteria bacterium]|nr:MAG: hypothetical protein EPO35_09665 [Acidobacteriota bacterium]
MTMPPAASILVVAATERELATGPWRSFCCGVGPIDAGVMTALEIARERPAAILHVGIAGARRDSGISVGSMVIGSRSVYCDAGLAPKWVLNAVEAPIVLIEAAERVLPHARLETIGTSALVGGTRNVDVEAMEGFGVLLAAGRARIPAIEIRAISNEIEETDRSRWQFDAAFKAITDATPALVTAIQQAVWLADA